MRALPPRKISPRSVWCIRHWQLCCTKTSTCLSLGATLATFREAQEDRCALEARMDADSRLATLF